MSTILYIKNMVCQRCILVVNQELNKIGLEPARISLGEVVLDKEPDPEQLQQVDRSLQALGFERIDDRKSRIIESIKKKVIQVIHDDVSSLGKLTWSDMLANELHYEYNYLSHLFSSIEGITLEQYIIRQKIERAKELLFYDELNLSQIADALGYSSVAHLSAQFKKITGFTPSEMKKSRSLDQNRKPLDSVS